MEGLLLLFVLFLIILGALNLDKLDVDGPDNFNSNDMSDKK